LKKIIKIETVDVAVQGKTISQLVLLIVLVCSFYIFSLWLKNVAMWKKENALKIFISSFAFLTRSVYFLGKLSPPP